MTRSGAPMQAPCHDGEEWTCRVAAQVAAIRAVQAHTAAMGGWSAEADATYYELGTPPKDMP